MARVIPFLDRLLVRRRKIGEKSGSLILPDEVQDRATDLADVVYVPDLSFADKELIENAELIVKGLSDKSKEGNAQALKALLDFNHFLKVKSIKVGDAVFLSKYIGTDFYENGSTDRLTLVKEEDIVGLVVE